MSISARVKQYRENRAWSQEHLSSVSGISIKTIQRIELDKSKASLESQQALSCAFDVPLKELLHGKEVVVRASQPKEYILEIYYRGDCIEQRIEYEPTVPPLPGEQLYIEFENSNYSESYGRWWLVRRRRHLKFGSKTNIETLMLDCVPDPERGT